MPARRILKIFDLGRIRTPAIATAQTREEKRRHFLRELGEKQKAVPQDCILLSYIDDFNPEPIRDGQERIVLKGPFGIGWYDTNNPDVIKAYNRRPEGDGPGDRQTGPIMRTSNGIVIELETESGTAEAAKPYTAVVPEESVADESIETPQSISDEPVLPNIFDRIIRQPQGALANLDRANTQM